ncbi:DUF1002 domain-containing protein [Clostridium sp. BJN0001]|uniref:DUF1002 domain-containing protein n=1 Tax=Clostridium sp. BJN0001 TaxID=2930219 RepID=UPI0032AF7F35
MTKKNKFMKIFVSSLLSALCILSIPNTIVYADSYKSVTLGADLSDSQKSQMLDYFGVTKETAQIQEVTSKEEKKYLGQVATVEQLGNRSISCSYVEPTQSGGLNIKTNNLTWVTDGMIKNALVTAGIENANVTAASPFEVSGTAALTGILKGFESSDGGQKIDEDKKEAANEEIVVTGDLSDKIGANDATNLINDAKKEVVKKKPETDADMNKILNDVTKDYKDKLSDDDIQKIKELMSKINDLNINYDDIKDQLSDISNQLKDKLNSKEARGFFAKIAQMLSDFFSSVSGFFQN